MKYLFLIFIIFWHASHGYALKTYADSSVPSAIDWPIRGIHLITTHEHNQSSSLESFFKYKGTTLLAQLSHPTSTYESGEFKVYSTHVDIKINYSNGYYTYLRVIRSGNYFSDIEVIEDPDWWPPFAAVHLMKELADEWLLEESDSNTGVQSKIESFLLKKYDDFTGKDLSLFILNMSWKSWTRE